MNLKGKGGKKPTIFLAKNSRGQITIFVIIAIIVVAVVASYFAVQSGIFKVVGRGENSEVYSFVESCISKTANEVVFDIGEKGGYYNIPELSLLGIPYYYYNKENKIPTINWIESEISSAISEKLPACTKNFDNFPDLQVVEGKISSQTEISNNEVTLDVKYPLSITKADSTIQIRDFRDIKIPVRLGIIYDSAKKTIETLGNDTICLSCIFADSDNKDLFYNVSMTDEGGTIFSITDKNSQIENKNFKFNFAIKY